MDMYIFIYVRTYVNIYKKGARGTEGDGLLEPAHKKKSKNPISF